MEQAVRPPLPSEVEMVGKAFSIIILLGKLQRARSILIVAGAMKSETRRDYMSKIIWIVCLTMFFRSTVATAAGDAAAGGQGCL